jgi:hypothetical protein
MTTNSRPLAVAIAALAMLLLGGAGAASAQQAGAGHEPAGLALGHGTAADRGSGQAPMGAAVGGSAPNPASLPTTTDNSQAQQGVLLKPGRASTTWVPAAGAKPQQ